MSQGPFGGGRKPDGARKQMTVIGAVKKNKMQPFYNKEEPEEHDEGGNYFGYGGAEKEGFGSPQQQVPFGGVYNNQGVMSPGASQGPLGQPGGGGKYSPRGVPGMGMRGLPSGHESMGLGSGGMPRVMPNFMQGGGMRQGYTERQGGPGGAPGLPGSGVPGGRERRLSYNSTLHDAPGLKGPQGGATPDVSEFPSLGSADQFPSLGSGNRSVGGVSPNISGVGAAGPMGGGNRTPGIGGTGSMGLGMPQFGGEGNLVYGKKQQGNREGFNAMSEDMFPSLPGAKMKSGGDSPHEDDPSGTAQQSGSGTGRAIEDRYRLIGLLPVVRNPPSDLKMMALGVDLTTLGLNLNSPDVLFPNFESPWSDSPMAAKPKEPAFNLPACYALKANLPLVSMRLRNVTDDTLFFVFYGMPGDLAQLAAAVILYERHWRYHKEQKIWITRAPGVEPSQKTNTYERGTYIYFDHMQWKKDTKEFVLQYDQLEERKTLPQQS